MSRPVATKMDYQDEWRADADCRRAVLAEPSLVTAWDNIDNGKDYSDTFIPDPQADVARLICISCPVRLSCLKDALEDSESEGIRGGFRFSSGTVSREDARMMYRELKIKAKVRRQVSSEQTEESEEV